MKKEYSAGFIIYNEDNNDKVRKYLLLCSKQLIWGFAKGKLEKDESIKDTAIRELLEETGINRQDIYIYDEFQTNVEYIYKNIEDNSLIQKYVYYFLAQSKKIDVNISFEHIDFKWLNYNDAQKTLTYNNSKEILILVEHYLNNLKQKK